VITGKIGIMESSKMMKKYNILGSPTIREPKLNFLLDRTLG